MLVNDISKNQHGYSKVILILTLRIIQTKLTKGIKGS